MHVILKAFRAKVLLFTIFSARLWKFVAYLVFSAMMAVKILSGLAEIWVMKPRLWSSVGNRAEDGHLLKQGKQRKCLTRYRLVSAHIWHCPAATIMGQEFSLSVFACSPNIKFHKFCSQLRNKYLTVKVFKYWKYKFGFYWSYSGSLENIHSWQQNGQGNKACPWQAVCLQMTCMFDARACQNKYCN